MPSNVDSTAEAKHFLEKEGFVVHRINRRDRAWIAGCKTGGRWAVWTRYTGDGAMRIRIHMRDLVFCCWLSPDGETFGGFETFMHLLVRRQVILSGICELQAEPRSTNHPPSANQRREESPHGGTRR